ncbi:MAG TPA: hypothetical protein VK492_06805 [Chitinophagaceae bacterium]|nr:hypothetical protein [Chitinophagaceae bacterium]
MIINRHNYEECFILYWDNELSAPQKQAVENFVKENQDLQEEFNILGQTHFIPDDNIQLEKKEFLLNNSFINITNYEEQLLNYIDDEVTADQRKEIERFAGQYSAVKQELTLLQKTKLQPEAEVVFPDKSILYRREEKVRVISMTWFRVAVAAAIILIAGFATFRLINTNGGTPPVAVIDKSKKQSSDKTTNQPISNPADQIPQDTKGDLAKTAKKSTEQSKDKKGDERKVDETVVPNSLIAKRENKNNLPEESKNVNQQPDNMNTTSDGIIAEATVVIKKDDRTAQTNQSEAINTDFHNQDVTLKETPTLYIPEQEEREKGGIKEFLRKTTRVFERRTRIQTTTDDNKLLLGAFAVSLK